VNFLESVYDLKKVICVISVVVNATFPLFWDYETMGLIYVYFVNRWKAEGLR